MQVIPNPASNNANLVFDMLTDAKVLVSVTDVTGKVVKSLTANSTLGQNTININVNDLTAGIYFVSVSANNQKTTAKLIVE
jgi:FAD synthase